MCIHSSVLQKKKKKEKKANTNDISFVSVCVCVSSFLSLCVFTRESSNHDFKFCSQDNVWHIVF